MIEIKIDSILENNMILFKKQNYDEYTKLYKLGNKKTINLAVISGNINTFKIDRDLFYYLSNQKEMYCFLLINKVKKEIFYLEFRNKINWLNSSFETSDKDELYFGKIVLKNKLSEQQLIEKLKKY